MIILFKLYIDIMKDDGGNMFLKKINKSIAIALIAVTVSLNVTNTINAMEKVPTAKNQNMELTEYGYNKVLVDDENQRVVETLYDGERAVATYDKITNIVTINQGTLTKSVDMNEVKNLSLDDNNTPEARVVVEEKTFSNYEYKYDTSSTKWILRRPNPDNYLQINSKSVTKTSSNSANLNNFKNTVDKINDLEFQFIGSLGLSVLSAVLTIVSSATTAAGAALSSLGYVGASYNYGVSLARNFKLARTYYFSV